MYRARAEAVSGTRVYADGKWLQCIGNKRVSVGDRIWTDGRCVYGYEREAQQPQVIPAPPQEDEGIPIAMKTKDAMNLYTFRKNKLKLVAKIITEKGKKNLYTVTEDQTTLVGEMPNTDKWTNYTLMINDTKKNVFLYDVGTHSKREFYGKSTSITNCENDFVTDTLLAATNMDKAGNRFDLIFHYESIWESRPGDPSSLEKHIYVKSIEILKNGETVKTFPPPDKPNLGFVSFFIENENSWYIIYDEDDEEVTSKDITERVHAKRKNYYYYGSDGEYTFIKSTVILKEFYDTLGFWRVDYDGPMPVDSEISYPQISNAKIPLGNDFYCVIDKDIYNFPQTRGAWFLPIDNSDFSGFTYQEFHFESVNTIALPKKIFTANGEQILLIYGNINTMPLVTKIKGGYLVGINGTFWATEEVGGNGVGTFSDRIAMKAGIFLLKNNNLSRIAEGSYINQLFRSMTKIKRWQNRLQTIEFEQNEI